MRRDQALFLAVGIVLGLVLGLIFGVLVSRPEMIGAAPAATVAPAAVAAPGASGSGDPHETGGMGSVTTQLATYRQRLETDPNDLEALLGMAEIYLQANMRDRALEPLQRAATLAGDDAQALTRAAASLAVAGQSRRALELATRAMELEKQAPEPAELAANIAVKGLADPEAARRPLAELRRRAPGAPIVADLEQRLAVIEGIVAAGKDRPNDPAAQIALGNLYYDTARWPEAEAAYRRALAAGSEDANAITDLGYVLYQQGRIDEALRQFELGLQKNPALWQAAMNGTVVSLNAGDRERARSWLDRLKSINPQHPSIPQLEQQVGAGAR